MEQYVKQCIEARYNAFFNTYEIDDNNKKRIDELFNKINEFGETCKDPGEFEGKFNTSSLNDEYLELFSNIATTCKQKDIEPAPVFNDEEAEQRRIKHQTKRMIEEVTRPMTRNIRWKIQDKIDETPLGIIDRLGPLKGIFKKNK